MQKFFEKNNYLNLPSIFYEKSCPDRVENPEILCLNERLLSEFEIAQDEVCEELISFLKNPKIHQNIFSQAYAGHQFGHFTFLGDGRAHGIGQRKNVKGETFEFQMKGSGATRYSRGGDGKAALGPMLREYLISEALHGLNILTTQSLAVIKTGEKIQRESLLDGALLVRVAKSHIRVGTFEFSAVLKDPLFLKNLADYVIENYYSDLKISDEPYLNLLVEVGKKQAQLIAQWLAVGFVHGVMNTDNMSIVGETIDFGPCAFIDRYDPYKSFSSIDRSGRYAYGNQLNIALWNISKFVESLLPLIDKNQKIAIQKAEEALLIIKKSFFDEYLNAFLLKIGIYNKNENDLNILNDFLKHIFKKKIDFTKVFSSLSQFEKIDPKIWKTWELEGWVKIWKERLSEENKPFEEIQSFMQSVNPVIIPRNYWVEQVIQSTIEKESLEDFNIFLKALKNPFSDSREFAQFHSIPQDNFSENYQTFCGT